MVVVSGSTITGTGNVTIGATQWSRPPPPPMPWRRGHINADGALAQNTINSSAMTEVSGGSVTSSGTLNVSANNTANVTATADGQGKQTGSKGASIALATVTGGTTASIDTSAGYGRQGHQFVRRFLKNIVHLCNFDRGRHQHQYLESERGADRFGQHGPDCRRGLSVWPVHSPSPN